MKTIVKIKTPPANISRRQALKLPPDPDGLFRRAATRAKKIIEMYADLNPGSGHDFILANLLHDLMHFRDRDPTFGDVGEEIGVAYDFYESLVEESKLMAGWPIGKDGRARSPE